MSHICPHCDKCFTTSSARRQHIRRIHMAVKTCSCKVCHKKFYSAKNCATHEEIHLDDSQRERPFRCDNCQNSFHQKHTLKNHIRNVHTTMKPFICEFCGKAFKVDYYRAAHLQRVHLKEKQYRCRECGKGINITWEIWNYLFSPQFHEFTSLYLPTNCTSSKRKNYNTYSTDFAKRIDLTNHFKVHQANRDRLPCPHCHRIFIGDKRLSSHIELTHQQKGFPCVFPGCGKKFSTDQVASFHYKTIHGTVRPFPCAHCDTTFKRKDTLAKHVARKHSNKFLFKCSTCGKSFNQKANLAQHERSHSTRKEFKCPQCPAQYRWRASLIQHIAEKHNNQNNPRLPCPISGCGATSKNKILLKVHLKLRNNSKKTKQCYFCPFMFHRTTNSHYHDHVRMHTTEKPFNCTKCYSSFSNKQVLNNHQVIKKYCC